MRYDLPIVGQSTGGTAVLFFWLVVLLVIVAVGAALVLWLRKWYASSDAHVQGGFTLAEIRKLHQEGRMTGEEYEKARMLILGQARRDLQAPIDPDSPNQPTTGDVKLDE
ncbi:MAG: hypothetical protein IT448_02055 [Phycisphaerales bacterium]|nr:hypothetical protein [Phycisphaerales bacterium]